jgi:hypothetical protein
LIIEEIEIRDKLNVEDIAFSACFTPMPRRLGDPRDHTSHYSIWIIDCVERGYLSVGHISKEFKNAWRQRSGFMFNNT